MIYGKDYKDYQLKKKGRFRKIARAIYLNNTLKFVKGKSIDFGCGTGELLSILPEGSIGFDVNPEIVEYCITNRLNVKLYQPLVDNYQLEECKKEEYKTIILSHLLEHLEEPDRDLGLILQSCKRLEIERVIIVVPGIKGFRHDSTHKTFIDRYFFCSFNNREYNITHVSYFPFNLRFAGNLFKYNEMIIIFDENKA